METQKKDWKKGELLRVFRGGMHLSTECLNLVRVLLLSSYLIRQLFVRNNKSYSASKEIEQSSILLILK